LGVQIAFYLYFFSFPYGFTWLAWSVHTGLLALAMLASVLFRETPALDDSLDSTAHGRPANRRLGLIRIAPP
jgi:hypothetical protein